MQRCASAQQVGLGFSMRTLRLCGVFCSSVFCGFLCVFVTLWQALISSRASAPASRVTSHESRISRQQLWLHLPDRGQHLFVVALVLAEFSRDRPRRRSDRRQPPRILRLSGWLIPQEVATDDDHRQLVQQIVTQRAFPVLFIVQHGALFDSCDCCTLRLRPPPIM